MLRDILRDVVAFVDGRNYAGECNQVTLPELNLEIEEFRGGGMDSPAEVDMGLQVMRCNLQFQSVPAEVMKLFGKPNVPITLRGALVTPGGTVKGATAQLRGKFIGQVPGDWQPGQAANFTGTFSATYYQLTVGGEQIHEIDVERMVRIINGEDQLAGIRDVLGL